MRKTECRQNKNVGGYLKGGVHMKALITGASSGLGRDMARILADYGIDLIVVARRGERLQELKQELAEKVSVTTVCMDLANSENCRLLYERVQKEDIDILINNAGFGLAGTFAQCDLKQELQMIDTNVKAVHILTKLFLRDFLQRDYGYILNVASSAAFLPGPLMATYYATKAYVRNLTLALNKEVRKQHAHVTISALCPGPTQTEFDRVAQVKFAVRGKKSMDVAKAAIDGMFAQKKQIIPGPLMKAAYVCCKFMPLAVLLEAGYHIQKRKHK